MSVLLCGWILFLVFRAARKRITQGIIKICFHILNLPLANLNPIIFLVKQYQYMQLNLDFCNSVRRSVHVCMFVHMCEFTYMFVCIHMEAWGLNWVSSFSTLYTEAVCWPGFFFWWWERGQLDIIWSHLGRGNANQENVPARLACRQACVAFSCFTGVPGPLGVVPTYGPAVLSCIRKQDDQTMETKLASIITSASAPASVSHDDRLDNLWVNKPMVMVSYYSNNNPN